MVHYYNDNPKINHYVDKATSSTERNDLVMKVDCNFLDCTDESQATYTITSKSGCSYRLKFVHFLERI